MQSSSLQWAVAKVMFRVPLPSVSHRVLGVEESRAVVNMDCATEKQFEELQLLRSELNCKSLVLVLLHTQSEHYTLLRRVLRDGVPQYTYWDSLREPSMSSHRMCEKFMDRLLWSGSVPAPLQSSVPARVVGVRAIQSVVSRRAPP